MLRCTVLALALALPAHTAFGFAPPALPAGGRQLAPRRAVALAPIAAPVRPRRTVGVFAAASMPAPATRIDALARSAAGRLATALLCTVATLLLTACKALAVAASKTAAASSTPFVVDGNVIKWGSVGLAFGAAYIFRREEKPIVSYVEDDEPPQLDRRAAPARVSRETDAAEPAGADEPTLDMSDGSMMGSLQARMLELARERAEAEERDAADEPPPSDSTDSWGEGSTAVLEPPRPSEGGDGPVDFPVGFPLRDFPEEPPAALASDDDIAMLERMFGGKPEAE